MVRKILTTIVAAATLSVGTILATAAPAATPVVIKSTTTTQTRPATTTTTKAFNLTDLEPAVKYIQGFTTTTHKSVPTTRPVKQLAKHPATTQPTQEIPKTSGCVWASKIREVWTQDAEWAIWVISKRGSWGTGESNCQAGAKNGQGSSASGLFQLTKVHTARLVRVCNAENARRAAAGLALIAVSFFDGECNIRTAWDLYSSSGRGPWKL